MKAHIVKDGVVVNTVEVNSLNDLPDLVEATEGGIGWHYSDGVFTNPNHVETDLSISVRMLRDGMLSSSDWTQVADAPVDKAAWATYRQALRDIPSQAGFPNEVTWPVEP